MCLLVFGLTLFMAFLVIVVGIPHEWAKQLGSWSILLLLFYLTVFFRAEADRNWLALKEQWLVVKRKQNA